MMAEMPSTPIANMVAAEELGKVTRRRQKYVITTMVQACGVVALFLCVTLWFIGGNLATQQRADTTEQNRIVLVADCRALKRDRVANAEASRKVYLFAKWYAQRHPKADYVIGQVPHLKQSYEAAQAIQDFDCLSGMYRAEREAQANH